uniref:Uncharacterized protein n=1 Tax=Trypanosoma congolense (strain IL3000) TaxID=1068625 RepID=G0UX71_TRYCI|nr:conserved hypothetical protein [Trypanosoma congolense IL3000]
MLGSLSLIVFLTLTTEVEGIPALQYKTNTRRALNCDKFTKNIADCDPDGYNIVLLLQAIPYGLVALFLFFFIPSYFFFKYFWNCCGGRNQSPNFCQPVGSSGTVYSKMDLIRPRIYAVLAAVSCVVATVGGCYFMKMLKECAGEVHHRVLVSFNDMEVVNNEYVEGLKLNMYDINNHSTYEIPLSAVDPRGADLKAAVDGRFRAGREVFQRTALKAVNVLDRIGMGVVCLFLLPTLFTVLGLVLVSCNYRRYVSMLWFFIIGYLAIGVWLFAGFLASINLYVTDSCFEVEEFTEGRSNILGVLAECEERGFSPASDIVEYLLQEQSRRTCEILRRGCYDSNQNASANAKNGKVFHCTDLTRCNEINEMDMLKWMGSKNHFSRDVLYNETVFEEARKSGHVCQSVSKDKCDVRSCAYDCMSGGALSTVGHVAKSVTHAVDAIGRVRGMHETVGSKLGSCEPVLMNLAYSLVSSCKKATNSIFYLEQFLGLLGLSCILAMFAYAIGAKRFIPMRCAYIYQND